MIVNEYNYNRKYHKKVESEKLKGVKNSVVKNRISFNNYTILFLNKNYHFRSMKLIKSIKYEPHSNKMNKLFLSTKIIRELY